MSKCKVCGAEAVQVWQPFGPGENARLCCAPGWHYRGYVALAVCRTCSDKINAGTAFTFTMTYKRQRFSVTFNGTTASAERLPA